jgi:5,10-methylenetetrahydromethanopterin reductase
VEFGTPHGRTDEHGVELIGKWVLPALRGTS